MFNKGGRRNYFSKKKKNLNQITRFFGQFMKKMHLHQTKIWFICFTITSLFGQLRKHVKEKINLDLVFKLTK
jgi:hypothetical protein